MRKHRKLRLDLQHLVVESFDSRGPAAVERGTVFGRQETQETNGNPSCFETDGSPSCFDSCTCLSCDWREGRPYYHGMC